MLIGDLGGFPVYCAHLVVHAVPVVGIGHGRLQQPVRVAVDGHLVHEAGRLLLLLLLLYWGGIIHFIQV